MDYWWKVYLRLKLRQTSGGAFQDFFGTIMGMLHGDEYVRVRPFGQKGDKGCDGYLQSTGEVYQCYGAINGDKSKVDYLISKMEEDFEKAKNHLGKIMKGWCLAHNLVDGLPVEAIQQLQDLRDANPEIQFGFIGLEGFEGRVGQLSQSQTDELLGPMAQNQDALDLQLPELQRLVAHVVDEVDGALVQAEPIGPVPADKLDANDLPVYWRNMIAGGWQNAHIVASYLDNHFDPMIGEKIAADFNARYQYLVAQEISPGSIMDSLYEYVTGPGYVPPARQVAAQALLAHLFESCDIFENVSLENSA